MQAGDSQRPLSAKPGIKSGMRLALIHAPADYQELLAPLPEPLTWVQELASTVWSMSKSPPLTPFGLDSSLSIAYLTALCASL
jgi:hypothetical protein